MAGSGASGALIEKSKELLIATGRWEMQQVVSDSTTIYKESTGKNIIDLIFATPLLLESLILCDIAESFDHDSDHQPIFAKWTMRIFDNLLSSRLLLNKIDIPTLNKMLIDQLAKDSL